MFTNVIESLAEEADRFEGYAKARREEAERQAREASDYQRRADELRMAIAVLRSANIVRGSELIARCEETGPDY